ncbi:hypothetical protein TNCV_4970831 [Trichonephila clavipes]|nr:hypothetical protein TNCV_4970831 [Trichonephila clavipes]
MPVARASGKERSQVTGALIATFIHLPKMELRLALTYPFSQPTVTISRHSFHKPTLMIKTRSCLSSASSDQSVRKGYAIGFTLPAYWCITPGNETRLGTRGKNFPRLQSKMLLLLTKTQNFLAMIQKWILPGSWRPVMHVDDVTRLGLVGGREGGSGFIWNTPSSFYSLPQRGFQPFLALALLEARERINS